MTCKASLWGIELQLGAFLFDACAEEEVTGSAVFRYGKLFVSPDLSGYVRRLRRSHLPLLLSLQDPVLQQWASAPVTNARIGFIQSTAHKQRRERSQFVHSMALSGVHVVDVPSDQLALSAVNHYLTMRSRDAL